MSVRDVAYGLGANLGDPLAALQAAVDLLAGWQLLHDVRVSAVYETDPVGGPDQSPYLNAVLVARSTASPLELLGLAYVAEVTRGRERSVRWGPRTLDVDLLRVGDLRLDGAALALPHPRAHERAFVLTPWAQVEPEAQLPDHGPVAALAGRIGAAGIRRTPHALHLPTCQHVRLQDESEVLTTRGDAP